MKMYKKIITCSMTVLLALTLSGCGRSAADSKAQISIPIHERIEYSSILVEKGDIEPEISLTLRVDDFHNITYGVDDESLELDKVYVSVGDRVKKGDLLVSFKAGDLEEVIKAYQNQLEEDALIIKHYKRLMELEDNESHEKKNEASEVTGGIDGEQEQEAGEMPDLSSSIADIEREMELIKVQMQEAQEKLKGYSLIAEDDGTITQVEEGLHYGYIMTNTPLITESCGSKDYVATTKDDYNFEIGSVYVAESGVAKYEMRLKACEASEQEGERELIFEPLSDMSGVSQSDSLTIVVKKPVLSDVLYVPAKAVFSVDDKNYVYVMDEEGFRDCVEVTVGETVGEIGSQIIIITSGLSGGERVMVR